MRTQEQPNQPEAPSGEPSEDYERMMESFLVMPADEADSSDESSNSDDSITPSPSPAQPAPSTPVQSPSPSLKSQEPKPAMDAAKTVLTDSVMTSGPTQDDKALHLSRHFPQLVQRIHQQVQDGLDSNGDWSIFKAAPQSTFVLPDLTSLSKELKEFIIRDLFQNGHLTTLESRHIINWHKELTPLVPLMTQGDGNCLLHAVSLGMFGIHDRQLVLREALHRALTGNTAALFKTRWRIQAARINRGSARSEDSLETEWDTIVKEASAEPTNPDAERHCFQYLGQMHVFVLAHILRRPIIVYAECKARDISTDQTIFELPSEERIDGIYLPLLLPQDASRADPLVLSFHSSHFAPLVATLPDWKLDGPEWPGYSALFPLVNKDQVPLPVHYLDESAGEDCDETLSHWLNVGRTPSGILTAEQLHLDRPDANIALLERYLQGIEQSDALRYPCKTGCGFTGTQATEGFCSLCYRKTKAGTPVVKLCNGGCGFYGSSNSGFCSTCQKRQGKGPMVAPRQYVSAGAAARRPSPAGFEEFANLLQPFSPKWVACKPQPTSMRSDSPDVPKPCRASGCNFHGVKAQEGYCSVCYKQFRK